MADVWNSCPVKFLVTIKLHEQVRNHLSELYKWATLRDRNAGPPTASEQWKCAETILEGKEETDRFRRFKRPTLTLSDSFPCWENVQTSLTSPVAAYSFYSYFCLSPYMAYWCQYVGIFEHMHVFIFIKIYFII